MTTSSTNSANDQNDPDPRHVLDCDMKWMAHITEYPSPNSHSRENPDPEGNWKKFLESGAILQADTLDELADAYGIDKANFKETVARYNELCEKGIDEDLGVNGTFMSFNAIKELLLYAWVSAF